MTKDPGTSPKPAESGSNANEGARRKQQRMRAGVAVGIGSAAIVAALLYANRGRKNDPGGKG